MVLWHIHTCVCVYVHPQHTPKQATSRRPSSTHHCPLNSSPEEARVLPNHVHNVRGYNGLVVFASLHLTQSKELLQERVERFKHTLLAPSFTMAQPGCIPRTAYAHAHTRTHARTHAHTEEHPIHLDPQQVCRTLMTVTRNLFSSSSFIAPLMDPIAQHSCSITCRGRGRDGKRWRTFSCHITF